MTHEQILQEIAALPPEGQQQVERFVVFLRKSYTAAPQPLQIQPIDWQTAGFIGMWGDRDEMQNSSGWVRQQRQTEWVN